MTAVCCPADVPCVDHRRPNRGPATVGIIEVADLRAELEVAQAMLAGLSGELERTRAELANTRILLNAIALAAVSPLPDTTVDLYDAVDQIRDRLSDIEFISQGFVNNQSSASRMNTLLRGWVSRRPFTYPVNPLTAAHEAQLAEATPVNSQIAEQLAAVNADT